jgi:hypothetical protein
LPISIIGLMVIGTAQAQNPDQAVGVKVFQAAGPNGSSIQSTVDRFRDALGDNNGVTPPPQTAHQRDAARSIGTAATPPSPQLL